MSELVAKSQARTIGLLNMFKNAAGSNLKAELRFFLFERAVVVLPSSQSPILLYFKRSYLSGAERVVPVSDTWKAWTSRIPWLLTAKESDL